jgi:hypothetical protein
LQLLGVFVKVEVDAAVLSSSLVDENVVEVVPQPLHPYDAQSRNLVVYDVLPGNLSLNHICADDVNDVVPYVEQLDEVLKLLLYQILSLLVQLVCNVRYEVQPYELASRGHCEEVRGDFVDAPVAFWKLRNRSVLP